MYFKTTLKTIIFFILSFSALMSKSWERTDMGYSNIETFKTTLNYQFVFFSSKSFWNDTLGNYGTNKCKGLAKIDENNMFDGGEVFCESYDQNNKKFIVLLSREKGDFSSGIGYLEFIDGEGNWKKFIGKKCKYAIQYIEEGFMRIDKCSL